MAYIGLKINLFFEKTLLVYQPNTHFNFSFVKESFIPKTKTRVAARVLNTPQITLKA